MNNLPLRLANLSHLFNMKILPSTTIRTALVDYRAQLLRLVSTYPETFKHTHPALIQSIDDALLSIEGNIQEVGIVPLTCAKWPSQQFIAWTMMAPMISSSTLARQTKQLSGLTSKSLVTTTALRDTLIHHNILDTGEQSMAITATDSGLKHDPILWADCTSTWNLR